MADSGVKKEYSLGDSAWVYGITTGPGYNLPHEGRVIQAIDIPGYSDKHYIIEIQNGIEPLLEVRSWSTISQDATGPVGAFREILMNHHADQKVILRTGMRLPTTELNPDFIEHAQLDSVQD